MSSTILIYELIDPITDITFYIGKTKNSLKSRLDQHLYNKEKSNFAKAKFIKSLPVKPNKPKKKRIVSDETKKLASLNKIERGFTKRVYRVDPNWPEDDCEGGGVLIFPSLSCACTYMGRSPDNVMNIVRACRTYQKAYGFHWMYFDDPLGLSNMMTLAQQDRNFRSESKLGELNSRFKKEPWNKGKKIKEVT